ncbi:uncharacterized protein [Procambarus clarkii]|uniref:uncharacterized protein n=1 Tax=Procambarus clarkii TaxID=6728 RepID=UPI003744B22C
MGFINGRLLLLDNRAGWVTRLYKSGFEQRAVHDERLSTNALAWETFRSEPLRGSNAKRPSKGAHSQTGDSHKSLSQTGSTYRQVTAPRANNRQQPVANTLNRRQDVKFQNRRSNISSNRLQPSGLASESVTIMMNYTILFLALCVFLPAFGAEKEDDLDTRLIVFPNGTTTTTTTTSYVRLGEARALNADVEAADGGVLEAGDGEHHHEGEGVEERDKALVPKEMRDALKIEALMKLVEGIEGTERGEEMVKLVNQLYGKKFEMKGRSMAASVALNRLIQPVLCVSRKRRCRRWRGGDCIPNGSVSYTCDYVFGNMCRSSLCSCCVDCENGYKKTACVRQGAHCRKDCWINEYEMRWTQCHSRGCRCCQTCQPTTQCSAGPNYGYCVSNWWFCNTPYTYITPASCLSQDCLCCKWCQRDPGCAAVGGYCVRAYQPCTTGYVAFQCGCNDNSNCWCCVPEAKQANYSCNGTTTTSTIPWNSSNYSTQERTITTTQPSSPDYSTQRSTFITTPWSTSDHSTQQTITRIAT